MDAEGKTVSSTVLRGVNVAALGAGSVAVVGNWRVAWAAPWANSAGLPEQSQWVLAQMLSLPACLARVQLSCAPWCTHDHIECFLVRREVEVEEPMDAEKFK